jgi:hypothetical protein
MQKKIGCNVGGTYLGATAYDTELCYLGAIGYVAEQMVQK